MNETLGVIESSEEYHSNKAIGSTTCKAYMVNPVKAYKTWSGEIEMKESQALIDGKLIHCLILEPHVFNDEFHILGDGDIRYNKELVQHIEENILNKRMVLYPQELLTPSGNLSSSKKAKEEIEAFKLKNGDCLFLTPAQYAEYKFYLNVKGKILITNEQYEYASKIAKKALAYEFQMTTTMGVFTFTLQDAINNESAIMERSFYAWYNPDTGEVTKEKMTEDSIHVKTKPDIMLEVGKMIYVVIDVKSAIDASPDTVRSAGRLFYHLQEAHYTKILEAHGIKVYKFKFMFTGKEEWSTCQDYEYGETTKDLGVQHFHKAMKMHRLAINGEVRETIFDGEKYDREPVVDVPNWLFYLD